MRHGEWGRKASLPPPARMGENLYGAVAKALGDAYAGPANDVEGYIACVKGQKK